MKSVLPRHLYAFGCRLSSAIAHAATHTCLKLSFCDSFCRDQDCGRHHEVFCRRSNLLPFATLRSTLRSTSEGYEIAASACGLLAMTTATKSHLTEYEACSVFWPRAATGRIV